MTTPPRRRFPALAARHALVCLAASLAAGTHLAGASEPPGAALRPPPSSVAARGRADGPSRTPRHLATLADYLAAFADAYETPSAERAGLAAAQEALDAVELDLAPRLSLRERLGVEAGAPELELGVRLELPLFDAMAAPRADLAAADVELRQLYAAGAREAALAALLGDLAALAVLSPAADAAARWLPGPAPAASEPLGLPPDERGAYEAATRAREAALWLIGAREDVSLRLSRRLALGPPALLSPPAAAELERALAAAFALADRAGDATGPALEGAVTACLDGSTSARVATARRVQALRAAQSDRALDVRVAVSGGIEGSTVLGAPGGEAGPRTTGSVSLEARFLLPAGWPVGGSIAAEVGTAGVSQELQLSWPPGRVPQAPADDPDEQLVEELGLAADDARAYLRALRSARMERARSERALAWALLDVAPPLPIAEAQRLAAAPWSPEWPAFAALDDLSLAELRLDAAMARLGELTAAIDVARHCGLLPAAGAG